MNIESKGHWITTPQPLLEKNIRPEQSSRILDFEGITTGDSKLPTALKKKGKWKKMAARGAGWMEKRKEAQGETLKGKKVEAENFESKDTTGSYARKTE